MWCLVNLLPRPIFLVRGSSKEVPWGVFSFGAGLDLDKKITKKPNKSVKIKPWSWHRHLRLDLLLTYRQFLPSHKAQRPEAALIIMPRHCLLMALILPTAEAG